MESIRNTMPAWFAPYGNIRMDSYAMLASLVTQPPSEDLLHLLRNLAWEEGIPEKLEVSLGALRGAAQEASADALVKEFNRLFMGLGCGEMVPYASWYRERKIQSLSLAALRGDLMALGIVRQADCHEPEDYAGALCETMTLISGGQNRIGNAVQAEFFRKHLAPWLGRFFQDLQKKARENFYRAVGEFGENFLIAEDEYLRYAGDPIKEGGSRDEQKTFNQPAGLS